MKNKIKTKVIDRPTHTISFIQDCREQFGFDVYSVMLALSVKQINGLDVTKEKRFTMKRIETGMFVSGYMSDLENERLTTRQIKASLYEMSGIKIHDVTFDDVARVEYDVISGLTIQNDYFEMTFHNGFARDLMDLAITMLKAKINN